MNASKSEQKHAIRKVAVAGATGYSGQELLKLLKSHPFFEVTHLIGREQNLELLKGQVDLAFLCTPNEVSLEMAPKLLELNIHVVDVSGAFRLKKHSYEDWYGFSHSAPAWLKNSEYALYPWQKIAPAQAGTKARLIANPGCFASAVLMGLLPLLKSGLVSLEHLVIDAKSGTSGAGRKAETRLLFSEIFGEFAPYKVGKHQHWPEIVEAVEALASAQVSPLFITELLPIERGISAAIFAEWKNPKGEAKLEALVAEYKKAYGTEPDIRVSTEPSLTSLKAVVNTNRVHIQLSEAFGRPVVFVVIDNLLRGAAGQALINANLLMGFDPQCALTERNRL